MSEALGCDPRPGGNRRSSESEPVITSFSDELRRFRRHQGLSQQSLGRRAGLSTEAISLLERGLRTPRVTTLRLLADALRLRDDERDALLATVTSRVPPECLLPRYGDALIGRDEDLSQLVRLLQPEAPRLITLTGPGGVGKTRLAVAGAQAAKGRFAAGVRWLVAAESSGVPDLVAALARAVGSAGSDSVDAVSSSIGDAALLLVIDGADANLGVVAAVADQLLAGTSAVTIVVTSRQRLRVSGEVLVAVPPLALPRLAPDGSPLDLDDSPATRLFRARASLPGQADRDGDPPSFDDTAAIARICHQVDGLPLALEAAAAQTTVWAITELANTLSASLSVLVTGADADRRLADIIIGDSFPSLSEAEQTMLARLSVYADRFTQADVCALAGAEASPSESSVTLSLLVAKSLVVREDDIDGDATFRLLRVIREFAKEQLADQHGCRVVGHRFARHIGALAAQASYGMTGRGICTSASTLDSHARDLEQALSWSVQHDQDTALTLVGAQWRWWQLRGHYRSGRAAAATALDSGRRRPAALRAPAYSVAGFLALLQSDYEGAQTLVQHGLDLYPSSPDTSGHRWSLALLGSIAQERGDYIVSAQLHQQSLVLATRADDPLGTAAQLGSLCQVAWLRGHLAEAEDYGQRALELASELGDQLTVATALTDLGTTARYRGDLTGADVLLNHGLELSRRIGFREGVAWSLHQLGVVDRLSGNTSSAEARQAVSLAEHLALGNRWRMTSVLDEQAALAVEADDPNGANRQLTRADQLRREINVPVPRVEVAGRDQTLARVRALLGSTYRASSLTSLAVSTG